MTVTSIAGVKVAGIASAVPETVLSLEDAALIFGQESIQKISSSTGVQRRHVASGTQCTSDFCFSAAVKLLEELSWETKSVDTLIFVSQTPDYLLPATSCSLHGRLGLSDHCAAFDLNLGCSGYVYGLWIASQIIACRSARRVLLLVGDTISRIVSPQDRSSAPLFGDAGSATALEADPDAADMHFCLGTDGTGQEHLIVPSGGFRKPRTEETSVRTERENGNIRSEEDLYMNGSEIFTFSLRRVPPLIEALVEGAGWKIDSIDAFVMHQANSYMIQYLAKKMKLPADRVVLALSDYGNTSSASIPLAITHALREQLQVKPMQLALVGFGVGLSWAAVALDCGPMVIPGLIYVPADNDPDLGKVMSNA